MLRLFKALISRLRDYSDARKARVRRYRDLDLGFRVYDEQPAKLRISLPQEREQEKALRRSLSDRLIIIEPADPEFSVGLNPLEQRSGSESFGQIGRSRIPQR